MPLCPHHADATTPPLGWTMNDLRSRNRALAPVPSGGPRTGEIVSTPPTAKPKGNPLFRSSRPAPVEEPQPDEVATDDDGPLTFKVSRDLRSMPVTAAPFDGNGQGEPPSRDDLRLFGSADEHGTDQADDDRAPMSRPSKRREVFEAEESEDDKFPWHHHFADDEPEELQAKSPLLSRAFRSSVG